jgi:hypothetical protein
MGIRSQIRLAVIRSVTRMLPLTKAQKRQGFQGIRVGVP